MDIITSLYDEPEKWKQSVYTLNHADGLMVWTCSGWRFYNTYPNGATSFLWKLKFWKAYRWWTENQPVTKGNNNG